MWFDYTNYIIQHEWYSKYYYNSFSPIKTLFLKFLLLDEIFIVVFLDKISVNC